MKDRYGLIGYPLGHSASQKFFTHKFEEENIHAEYLKFEIANISDFPNIIDSNPQLKGLNVTSPYKEQVIAFLDGLDADTQQIGAVNVIKINREGSNVRLIGYNSDLIGFQSSLAPLIKEHHTHALVLGTGGASKSVAQALRNLGIAFVFVSRQKQQDQTISYEDIDEAIMQKHTLIINTTPVGTYPNVEECPNIPYHYLTSKHLLYDVVYNPVETKFLKLGLENGASIKNGEEMLNLQAVAAWKIWNK